MCQKQILGNGGVSNCSIAIVSEGHIVSGEYHERVKSRKEIFPQHVRVTLRNALDSTKIHKLTDTYIEIY